MMLDPIPANPPPAVPDAAPARAPAPEILDDVKLKLDADNGVILQFTDKKSGEVVRQIPSEQVLSVVRFIRQLLEEDQTANTNA
jgi:hypothetical protein